MSATSVISVDIDGRHASWDGTVFTGDADLVHAAEEAADEAAPVAIFGLFPVPAGRDEPIGRLAALAAFKPGRMFVTQAPADVVEWLDEAFEQTECSTDM